MSLDCPFKVISQVCCKTNHPHPLYNIVTSLLVRVWQECFVYKTGVLTPGLDETWSFEKVCSDQGEGRIYRTFRLSVYPQNYSGGKIYEIPESLRKFQVANFLLLFV